MCVPGCTVEESFAGRPEWQLACYRVVVGRLRDVGAVHEDAVGVGVFLKAERKFAELRPKARSLQVWFALRRRMRGERVARALPVGGGLVWHVVHVREPADVDEELLGWLTEALVSCG